jgi:hypothetical protein
VLSIQMSELHSVKKVPSHRLPYQFYPYNFLLKLQYYTNDASFELSFAAASLYEILCSTTVTLSAKIARLCFCKFRATAQKIGWLSLSFSSAWW